MATRPQDGVGENPPHTSALDSIFPAQENGQPSFLWLLVAIGGGVYLLLATFTAVRAVAVRDVVLPLAAIFSYWAFVRYVEHRRCYELRGGFTGVGQFGLGCALALLQPGLVIAVWYALGVNRIAGLQQTDIFLHTLDAFLFLAAIAVYEELLFRGLLLRYLELKLGSYPAIALSALAFGAWHVPDGRTGITLVMLAVFGIALACAYVLTRRLWLSMGLHIGYNLSLGLLFARSTTIPLFRWEAYGSPFWVSQTGGALLWLGATAVLAAALLAAVIVRRSGVSPSKAWLRQIGVEARADGGPQDAALTSASS